jgi:hypothetical protein
MNQLAKHPQGRTRLDNGKLWHRAAVDGRTARRLAAIAEGYELLMGHKPSNFERDIIRAAACQQVLLDAYQEAFANGEPMPEGFAVLCADHTKKLERLGVLKAIAPRVVESIH